MPWVVDLIYLVAALISAPVWLFRLFRTGKIRTDWAARFGLAATLPRSERPRVLIHAVSVGEVNAVRLLVDRLAGQYADSSESAAAAGVVEIVISTTTDTGFKRASDLFGDHHRVVRYPLDFSFCVRRFLDAVAPDVVALTELEVWPNFTADCARRRIPVCVINGRLTARSARRYAKVKRLVRPSFGRLKEVAAQDEDYAARFRSLGAPSVNVTGTMKWDTAEIADDVPGAGELARSLGIDRDRPLVVAGSTARDEHELLVQAVGKGVQLLCAPRKPEWFDHAASVMTDCARRSKGDCGSPTGRFLLDTIGELRMAYALADIVVIGRSFGQLYGSDMMEPVALGKPVVVGPAVADFQQTVDALLAGQGIIQTTRRDLAQVLRELLDDPARRASIASRGRAVILAHQGATERHADLVRSLLPAASEESCSGTR